MNASYWDDFEEHQQDEYPISDFVKELADRTRAAFQEIDDDYFPAYLGLDNSVKIYSLIRNKKPETVVETGVCNGMSSAVILKALKDNGKGRLYSVDLPVEAGTIEDRKGAVIPPGKTSGWLVTEEMKDIWELYLGDTYYELPKVMEKVREIDIYLHDSDHSYETMMFEFGMAWHHLRSDGVILADNTDKNDAFKDFARAKHCKLYRMNELALIIKS